MWSFLIVTMVGNPWHLVPWDAKHPAMSKEHHWEKTNIHALSHFSSLVSSNIYTSFPHPYSSSCFLHQSKYQSCCIFPHISYISVVMNELSQFLSNPNLSTQALLELIPFCLLNDITPLISPSPLSRVTFPDLLPPHSLILCPFEGIHNSLRLHFWFPCLRLPFSLKFTPTSLSPQCSRKQPLSRSPRTSMVF